MKKFVIFSFWFVIFEGASANESKDDLCKPNEIIVASCSLDEKKNRVVSFCASTDSKVIFYRFGTKSRIELMRVFSIESPIFRWVDSATYTTYFGFRSSGYAYTFGVPQEALGAKAFLEVTNLNSSVMSRTCTENSFGKKSMVSDAIREVEDSVVREAGFLFPPNNIILNKKP